MIIKTDKNTYYVTEFIKDDVENDLLIFKGFKNISSLTKISIRKIRLKKQHVIGNIDLSKQIVLIGNSKGDIRRLLSIKDLIELNKNVIDYLPFDYREVVRIYNNATKKFIDCK